MLRDSLYFWQESHGKDSRGNLRCALANTEWGKIPGYVRESEGTCYFVYNGARSTTDFSLVKGAVLTDDANEVLPLGDESGVEVYCAVARTPHGTIPGRARNGDFIYAYDGEAYYDQTAISYVTYIGPRLKPLDISAGEIRAKVRKTSYCWYL